LNKNLYLHCEKYSNITGQKIYDNLLNDKSNENILKLSVSSKHIWQLIFWVQFNRSVTLTLLLELVPRPRMIV